MPRKGGPKGQGDQTYTPGEREEQRIEALRLWMTGSSYRKIGQALGVTHTTAFKRVQQALDEMRPHAEFDKYRAVQLAELEMGRRPLRQAIIGWRPGDDIDTPVKAIGALLKIQEREAKLLGLDRVQTPVDELTAMSDEDLAAMVAKWADELAADTDA